MSADNGVYILHCKDGFRVKHTQAIDNVYWNCHRKTDPEFNARQLFLYFSNCKVFQDEGEAFLEAKRIYDEIMRDDCCPIIEYGICSLGNGTFEFPKELPPCCDTPTLVTIDGQTQCYNCGEYMFSEDEDE